MYILVDNVDRVQRRADEQQAQVYGGPYQRRGGVRRAHGILVGAQRAQIPATSLPAKFVHVPDDRHQVRSKFSVLVHVDSGIGQSRLELVCQLPAPNIMCRYLCDCANFFTR